jgi:hypothetical protein
MSDHNWRNAGASAVLAGLIVPAESAPAQQNPSIPQLGFANYAWSKVADDFQAIPGAGPGPVMSDKAHPYRPNGGFEGLPPGGATFRIADLNNPILKPAAIESMRKANELAAAGKQAYEARASCHPGGVPGYLVMGRLNPLYIVQGARTVVLINEGGPEVRHIYLDVPHTAHPTPSPYGESIGHYEGDTLVVDTIGLSADTYIDNYRTPHTTQEHVIERYRLIDGGAALQVDIRVEDPGTFNMAWSARQVYRKGQPLESLGGQLLEAICSENNPNFLDPASVSPIPVADKADF